jgi:hypothetical protein
VALEDLAKQVKYPCKYRSYGCTETFDHDTIGGHQAICLQIPQKCPFAKLAIRKCSWTESYDMEKHLKEIHLELCFEYVEGDFKFLYNLNTKTKFFCFRFAYNEVFFSHFSEKDGTCYAVVLYVGPPGNAAQYKYKNVKFELETMRVDN